MYSDKQFAMRGKIYRVVNSENDKVYIGSTKNLSRRLSEHNSGHTKSTKNGIPWKIVFTKQLDTSLEAHRYELSIKKMKSRIYIEKLVNNTT